MKHIRKNWRRFAAVLLSAALMISTVSQTAFAAGADTGKAIQFVDGGTAANISGGRLFRNLSAEQRRKRRISYRP